MKWFSNRNLWLLMQGHAVSKLGTAVFTVGLVLWLKNQMESATLIGMVMMATTIPEIILSPFSGTWVDMKSRKSIIILSDLINGLTVLSAGIFLFMFPAHTGWMIGMIIMVSFILGVSASFFNPAVTALIPELVEESELQSANSLYQFFTNLLNLTGQGLGGVLFGLMGAPMLFLSNGISFILSAFSEGFIQSGVHSAEKHKIPDQAADYFNKLREGLVYISRSQGLGSFLLIMCLYHLFVASFPVIYPFYVTDCLQLSSAWYGYIMADFGLGVLAGLAVMGAFKVTGHQRMMVVMAGLLISAASTMGIGLISFLPITLLLVFLTGCSIAGISLSLTTVVQLSTPKEYHGRVFGLYHTLTTASMPIGMLLSGLALDFLKSVFRIETKGSAYIMVFCGLGLGLTALYILSQKSFRRLLSYSNQPIV
ncbi:MAG: MFS transporter [Candidatus Delongbacteria bacterium]|nr:MFS transporter [Candidatus Delongbacteria bacterium]